MFADSLLDPALTNRSRRGWATLISFCTQTVAVGALLTIPLLYTQGRPSLHLMRSEVIGPPPAQDPSPKVEHPHGRTLSFKSASGLVFMIPKYIPKGIAPATDAPVGPPPDLLPGLAPGDGPPGVPGVLNSMGGTKAFVIPTRPVIHHPPTSHMMEAISFSGLSLRIRHWQFKPAHRDRLSCKR